MNKTVSITIAGMLFHIEEQAYKRLEEYLNAVRAHFAHYDDHDEIVADIESRIAEQFSAKLGKSREVLSAKDIDDLIQSMGTVKDFEKFESHDHGHEHGHGHAHADSSTGGTTGKEHDTVKSFFARKRLFRDPADQVIAGVCSGLANYFGIDPVIVRVLFVVATLLWGYGVLLYIILWLVMPEAKTVTDRVEMSGQRVTLSALDEKIRATVPKAKKKFREKEGTIRRIIGLPFLAIRLLAEFITKVIRMIVPLVARILGAVITIAASLLLFAATFVLIVMVINAGSAYIDLPLKEFLGPTTFYLLLFSLYGVVLIPGILITVAGASLSGMRNLFSVPAITALGVEWLAALMVAAVTVFVQGPAIQAKVEQYRSQHMVQTHRDFPGLKGFTSIDAGGSIELVIRKGDTAAVAADGSLDQINDIQVSVENGILHIGRTARSRICLLCGFDRTTVAVTLPVLGTLTVHGASSASLKGFDRQALNADFSGSSHLYASGQFTTVDGHLSGASSMTLSGSAVDVRAQLSGSSHLSAFDLTAADVNVDASGASSAEANATASITANLRGSSRLYYIDRPDLPVKADTSGASWVQKMDPDDLWREWRD